MSRKKLTIWQVFQRLCNPKSLILQSASISLLITSSCTKNETQEKKSDIINLAIWGNYFPESEQKKFTESTGLKLNITNYSSNEELLARVQMGASGIDIAVPSDYMVGIMKKLDLLEPLKKERITNFKKISETLLKKEFDPENTYSLPFSWTTTGIAIQRDLYKGQITSWKDFFEKPELKGKIAVLDDSRESLAAIHKIIGSSVNTTNSDELKKAKDYFLKIRGQVKIFTSDTVEILKNKEVYAAQSYSSDALQARRATNGKIEYIIPSEGSTIAIDNFVIFKSSKNKDNAYRLIDYMLETDRNKNLVESQMIGPVISDVRNKLTADLQKDSGLFPDKGLLSKLEELRDLGDSNRLVEDIWVEIKNQ